MALHRTARLIEASSSLKCRCVTDRSVISIGLNRFLRPVCQWPGISDRRVTFMDLFSQFRNGFPFHIRGDPSFHVKIDTRSKQISARSENPTDITQDSLCATWTHMTSYRGILVTEGIRRQRFELAI